MNPIKKSKEVFNRKDKSLYKRVFVLVFVLLSSTCFMKAVAQRDILMTQAGEQIRCKILNETPTRFVYIYVRADGKILQSEIFKSLIKEFQYGRFSDDILDATGKPIKLPTKEVFTRTPKATKKEELEQAKEMEKKALEVQRQATTEQAPVVESKPRRQSPPRPSIEYIEAQKELERKSLEKQQEGKAINEKKNEANNALKEKKKKEKQQREIEAETVAKLKKQAKLKTDAAKKTLADTNSVKNFLRFRVGVKGGFANVLKKITATDEYSNYQKDLQKGSFFGVDAAFFPLKSLGLGVMFTNFQTKNTGTSIHYNSIIDASKQNVLGKVSDKVSSKFFGGVLYYRQFIAARTSIVLGLSPGMNFYTDQRTENYSMISAKGHRIGGAATLAVDYALGKTKNRDILLTLEGGYNYAKYNKLNYGNGDVALAIPLDMSNWNVTLGLHFTRFPKVLRAFYN